MEIQAYAAAEIGGLLHPFRYSSASLIDDQVLIEVSHCGICHSDLHMIDNDWNGSAYPLVPGHEVMGVVVEVGPKGNAELLGKTVGLGWQAGSCGHCDMCHSDNENLCPTRESTIVKRHGGFASHVVASSKFVFRIPDGMDLAASAPLLCAGVTVYSPMAKAGLNPKLRAGVMGIGGLGHLSLQFAKAHGCHVTALSSTVAKQAEAAAFGADEFVHVGDPGAIKLAKNSLDFLLVTSTVDLDWKPYVQMLRNNGTICFVTGEDTQISLPVSLLLEHQLKVTGSMIGSIKVMENMFAFAHANGIQAKVETMPMKEVNAALTKVRRNQARYRMVLTT